MARLGSIAMVARARARRVGRPLWDAARERQRVIKGLAGLGAGRGDVNDFDSEGADRSGEDLYDVGVVEGSDVGNEVRSQG